MCASLCTWFRNWAYLPTASGSYDRQAGRWNIAIVNGRIREMKSKCTVATSYKCVLATCKLYLNFEASKLQIRNLVGILYGSQQQLHSQLHFLLWKFWLADIHRLHNGRCHMHSKALFKNVQYLYQQTSVLMITGTVVASWGVVFEKVLHVI